jgi:hypothetical protein
MEMVGGKMRSGFQLPYEIRTELVSLLPRTSMCDFTPLQSPSGPWPPLYWSLASSSSAAVSVSTGSVVGGGWARKARPKPKFTFRK